MLAGRIAYIDEPLYDYVQHRENEIGYCTFPPSDLPTQTRSSLARARTYGDPTGAQRVPALSSQRIRPRIPASPRRIARAATPLSQTSPAPLRRALGVFSNTWATLPALLRVSCKVWWRGYTTNEAEIRLGLGYLAASANRLFYTAYRRRLMSLLRSERSHESGHRFSQTPNRFPDGQDRPVGASRRFSEPT